jgi:hypothetical protein
MKVVAVEHERLVCFEMESRLFFHGEILVPGKASPEVTAEA